MLTFLGVAYYTAVALGTLALCSFVWRRYFQVDRTPDSVHYVTTDDGWRLALCRYLPPEPGRRRRTPVLLCPGMGMSGAQFTVGDDCLVAALTASGHEVWTLDPRGKGWSSRPRLWGRHQARWLFDDYVEFDLPAAVIDVCRRSGAEQLHLVGFGLGGSAALCLLGGRSVAAERVASCVAIAATAFFGRQAREVSPRLLRLLGRLVPVRALVGLLSPLIGRLSIWPLSLLYDRDNVDPAVVRRLLVNAFGRLTRRELAQLARWIELDQFGSADERQDYRARLAAITTPSLLVLGPHDRVCPATAVQQTLDQIGAEHKALLFAGREGGLSTNCGHFDLLIGRTASRDLFARLGRWIDEVVGAEAVRVEPRESLDEVAPSGTSARGPVRVLSTDEDDDRAADDDDYDDDDDDENGLFADPLERVVGDVPNIPRQD